MSKTAYWCCKTCGWYNKELKWSTDAVPLHTKERPDCPETGLGVQTEGEGEFEE